MAFSLVSASRDVSRPTVPRTTTTTTTRPTTTTSETTSVAPVTAAGNNVLLIVGVCIAAFLVLLLLAILLVVCLYRKCHSSEKPPNALPTWMDVYKDKFGTGTVQKPGPKWSDIYELNTSRFPIYDTAYSPTDLKVTIPRLRHCVTDLKVTIPRLRHCVQSHRLKGNDSPSTTLRTVPPT